MRISSVTGAWTEGQKTGVQGRVGYRRYNGTTARIKAISRIAEYCWLRNAPQEQEIDATVVYE